jgi:hypothetical protein
MLALGVSVALALASERGGSPAGGAEPGGPSFPEPVIEPTIPKDVDLRTFGGGANKVPIAQFDDYSWRAFIGVNWPAKPLDTAGRGQADTDKHFGDAADRVIWETWKADYELFQEEPETNVPTEWKSLDARTPCPGVNPTGSGKERILAAFTKFGDFNQATFTGFGSPLVARNHTYVRYEIRLNEEEFGFLWKNHYYLRSELEKATAAAAKKFEFDLQSIEVKASWLEVLPGKEADAKARLYTTTAKVYDPIANVCRPKLMALVGLHLVQKTKLCPEWIWSSFEHVDNVPPEPPPAKPDPAGNYSFNDTTAVQQVQPVNMPPPIGPNNLPKNPAQPNMQVVRERPISASTKVTNQKYHDAIAKVNPKSVWLNYRLVLTQWPTPARGRPFFPRAGKYPGIDPQQPDVISTAVTNIANTTMETYFQKDARVSCMVCHQSAKPPMAAPGAMPQPTDFVWFVNFHAWPPAESRQLLMTGKVLQGFIDEAMHKD